MNVGALISLLSDGCFHSGSELGERLGVSRAAIWKALGRLEEYGLSVESVKGKGYRLVQPLSLLDEEALLANISDQVRKCIALDVFLSVDSTNQLLINSESQTAPYQIVLAERQTSGRGRRGRSWVSPFAKNLYMSVGFELSGGVEVLSGLSLIVGIGVVRAINKSSSANAKLKWPNDVWIDGKKVAGILVELQGEATTGWRVVVGLGVNISMDESEAGAIDQPWVALGEYLSCGKNEFVVCVIEELIGVLSVFSEKGLEGFVEEWKSMDLLYGRSVKVSGSDVSGVAEGIDASGALVINTGHEKLSVNAGEVSVRPDEA